MHTCRTIKNIGGDFFRLLHTHTRALFTRNVITVRGIQYIVRVCVYDRARRKCNTDGKIKVSTDHGITATRARQDSDRVHAYRRVRVKSDVHALTPRVHNDTRRRPEVNSTGTFRSRATRQILNRLRKLKIFLSLVAITRHRFLNYELTSKTKITK